MGPLWEDLLARPHIRGPPARRPPGPPTGRRSGRIDTAVTSTPRVLFTGDAVAACDVMTGEGIGQALLTGVRAAESIRDRAAVGDVATHYHRTVTEELVADHRMSQLLVRALQHRKGARAAIRVAGATPWTRRNFARVFEGSPRGIAFTPSWHQGSHRPRRLSAAAGGAHDANPADPTNRMLGIEHPVMLAGMGGVSYAPLAAAVSNAGGIGTLGASTMGTDEMAAQIAAVAAATDRPFGVDLLTAAPQDMTAKVHAIAAGGGSLFVAGLGVPGEVIASATSWDRGPHVRQARSRSGQDAGDLCR